KIQSTLVSAVGIDPHGPAAPQFHKANSSAWQPRFLSPAQIEQFLADGFLLIPRAFDPDLARRWREDANRRIREEPQQWVRGYDPTDERKTLRDYSPNDPSTWTWPRLVLEGNVEMPVDEFAPTAWAAICDLLGGPERIKTRSWSNYLNLNFNEHAELGFDRPRPDWVGWHIDDPHPAMRLDGIQNGLVCITLFDAVLPASGNTWLCPDSVARVARELAEHPEGVDFVTDRGARITKQCTRFHEVVGETGDVFLLHPLLMHSSSPNRSGRIRWMGNPMVYMQRPLDPLRPRLDELSPVELAIRQAIS
ncbi:MAG TPA: phytanoyl-CoA dioxygenase family protein, partial [Enhygromyxa sp.]|nr:phytanoyl-CoA dioxygenase family protein [Enhygromyxa sp.]